MRSHELEGWLYLGFQALGYHADELPDGCRSLASHDAFPIVHLTDLMRGRGHLFHLGNGYAFSSTTDDSLEKSRPAGSDGADDDRNNAERGYSENDTVSPSEGLAHELGCDALAKQRKDSA